MLTTVQFTVAIKQLACQKWIIGPQKGQIV
jgi:hypothetical protein